jgi:tRNA nucleotidyltransferase (CCA-adding enzyme)
MNAGLTPEELLSLFEASLSKIELPVVVAARNWSAERQAALFLVGGSTRDLILGRPHLDLDIAVEGDAAALGRRLAEGFAATATVHDSFGTAVVEGHGWRIDVARTRVERYAYPGALPEVAPAGIVDDLARRDFAAHAVALRIAPTSPLLIDPFGGMADIAAGRLRVLHTFSFTDDPTRVLRLARYASRLGWLIEASTDDLARRDAPLLANIAPARIGHEIARTLEEPEPEKALGLLAERYAAAARAAALIPHQLRDARGAFAALRGFVASPSPVQYLATLAACGGLREDARATLALTGQEERAIHDARRALEVASRLAQPAAFDPVALTEALDHYETDAVIGALAALEGGAGTGRRGDAPFAAALLARYLREWREMRPWLDGNDVIAAGVPNGPAVGQALNRLRAARIRGEATTADDERDLLARLLAEGTL